VKAQTNPKPRIANSANFASPKSVKSVARIRFLFNRHEDRLAREQLARKVKSLLPDATLLVICNMPPEPLDLYGFPTDDESGWFRSDIQFIFESHPDYPDEWAEQWQAQAERFRRANV